ncbi:MAG: DNA repair protein RecN [Betaproteobacteria bacterium HGW-Betaproteobacteria-11]|nr:MAG: DNA repair protein RecN [Betaproteobacteria bacterium HGW-Betaproteobacteria-11]
MLSCLLIRDFVIVDRLELDFEAGFGVLTGETGAGKSILVDALSLALGERADALVVRAGAKQAEICAEFTLRDAPGLADWLAANDFDSESCLLRRIVDGSGRSRAYINGAQATLGQLREAADFLADIHGQHAHLSLLKPEAQRALLDAQGGAQALAQQVAAAWRAWCEARTARLAAEQDGEASVRERELLTWQIRELTELAFDAGSWQTEQEEQRRLGHVSELQEGVAGALAVLDEGEAAALSALHPVGSRLAELAVVDPALEDVAQLFEGALIQLEESALALRRYQERLELDPARLTQLDERIQAVTQMARKHRVPAEELPAVLARLRARAAALSLSADPAALAAREREAEAAYRTRAGQLSALRVKTAATLAAAVSHGMQELAMAGGRFEIALTPLAAGSAHGIEDIEFQVAANAGQPLRPLAKVASGGELSRIGLVLQVMASQAHPAGTLIFDEVDVGIGGRVAEIVGRLLRELGRSRQVLCVTHLPQVAAQADWQWSIAKETVGAETLSRVQVLDAETRIGEIARMLGGERITETTRRHAAEMLGFELPASR